MEKKKSGIPVTFDGDQLSNTGGYNVNIIYGEI